MCGKGLSILVLSVLCLVHVANCWIDTEFAPITDESLLAKGYSCQSSNEDIGLMMEGERKTFPDMCAEASCISGEISYARCDAIRPGPGCITIDNTGKPFPDCCPTIHCEPLN